MKIITYCLISIFITHLAAMEPEFSYSDVNMGSQPPVEDDFSNFSKQLPFDESDTFFYAVKQIFKLQRSSGSLRFRSSLSDLPIAKPSPDKKIVPTTNIDQFPVIAINPTSTDKQSPEIKKLTLVPALTKTIQKQSRKKMMRVPCPERYCKTAIMPKNVPSHIATKHCPRYYCKWCSADYVQKHAFLKHVEQHQKKK